LILQNNEAKLIFNDTLIQTNVTKDHMSLEMTGPNAPYQVDWSGKFTKNNEFTISFSVSPIKIGGFGEKMIISINNVNAFQSEHEIPLGSEVTLTGEFDKIESSAAASGASKSASYTFLVTAGLSVAVSIFTGGSMELMWSLTNTLQLLFYIGALKLYFTPELKTVFEYMKYSDFDNPITEYLSKLVLSDVFTIRSPINSQFEEMGFISTNFIGNMASKLPMIALII
jgi:hypothetical protein